MTHTTQTPTTAQMLAAVAAGLKAWRDELQDATPGPWIWDGANLRVDEPSDKGDWYVCPETWGDDYTFLMADQSSYPYTATRADVRHICTLHNREPRLLAYLEGRYKVVEADLLTPQRFKNAQVDLENEPVSAVYLVLHDRALAELAELYALCGGGKDG